MCNFDDLFDCSFFFGKINRHFGKNVADLLFFCILRHLQSTMMAVGVGEGENVYVVDSNIPKVTDSLLLI